MPEINHDEPKSIIETHMGGGFCSECQPEHEPEVGEAFNLRQKLEGIVRRYRYGDIQMTGTDLVDLLLDTMIPEARSVSAHASLFLKRVKEGRA